VDDVVTLGDQGQSGSGLGAGRRGRAEGPAYLIAAGAGLFAVVDEDQHVLSAGRAVHDTLDLASDHGGVTNGVHTRHVLCSGARYQPSVVCSTIQPSLFFFALLWALTCIIC
jgi:hypothetical protein